MSLDKKLANDAALAGAELRDSVENIVIVGGGVVGAATARAFGRIGHSVQVVEISSERRLHLEDEGFRVSESVTLDGPSIVFLSVPTPAGPSGYDLEPLRTAAWTVGSSLAVSPSGAIVAVRSTVAPGTTSGVVSVELERASGLVVGRDFHVASAPEFLREASAAEDASNPWMTVLGCADEHSLDRLAAVFRPLGGQMRLFGDPACAEAIKIAHNCYNAMKISFFNEVSAICDAAGVDAEDVAEVVVRSAEAQLNPDYGRVGGRPFGGACLPKDLNGLIAFAQEVGVDPALLQAVRSVNLSMPVGS